MAEGVRAPKVVQIDLSELYTYIGPEDTAAGILGGILTHYKGYVSISSVHECYCGG